MCRELLGSVAEVAGHACFHLAGSDMHAPQRPGRCARAQAQERRDREVADADAMQAQYGAAWAGAEATHAQGRQLLDDLTRARALRALPRPGWPVLWHACLPNVP